MGGESRDRPPVRTCQEGVAAEASGWGVLERSGPQGV